MAALYVASRLFVLSAFKPEHSDAEELYRGYAMANLLAERAGESVYRLNQRRRVEENRVDPGAGQIEYPPLGLALITLPGRAAGELTEETANRWGARYLVLYRALMAAFEALALALVVRAVRRLYPDEGARGVAVRLALPIVGGGILAYLLFDRLDLTMSALLAVALALLVSRVHWLWSFAALAVAINFKLVPLGLAPIWVVGSLPPSAGPPPWAAIARRSATLAGLVVTCFLPFLAQSGAQALGFLRFHGERGLQIESALATLLMLLRPFGLPYRVVLAHGSAEMKSATASATATLSLALLAAVGIAELGLLLRLLRAPAAPPHPAGDAGATLAQRHPREIVLLATAALMATMLGSKVFSPQYLIWLLPLVPLLPIAGRPRWAFFAAFLAACGLSTLVFPLAYNSVAGTITERRGDHIFMTGPTGLGVSLLLARNAVFGAMTVWLARRSWAVAADRPDIVATIAGERRSS